MASNNKVLITIAGDSKGAQKAVSQLLAVFEKLPNTLSRLDKTISSLDRKLNTSMNRITRGVDKAVVQLDRAGVKAKNAGKNLDVMGRSATNTGTKLQTTGQKAQNLRISLANATKQSDRLGTSFAGLKDTSQKMTKQSEAAKKLSASLDKAATSQDKLNKEQAETPQSGLAGILTKGGLPKEVSQSVMDSGVFGDIGNSLKNVLSGGGLSAIGGVFQSLMSLKGTVTSGLAGLASGAGGATAAVGGLAAVLSSSLIPILGAVGIALTTAAVKAVQFAYNLRYKVIPDFVQGMGQGFSNFFNGAASFIMRINQLYYWVIDAVRLAAQGMTNLGRTMMFWVSIPVGAALGAATKAAIDFDDAMTRVKKTTGLAGDALKSLREDLRQVATRTSTTHTELAKIAEQIGQVGVANPKSIARLTEVFNQLAVATDITADEVGISMGRIAAAFEMDLNTAKGVGEITKLASVINELENQFATSAGEVVTATLKYAQAAHAMGLTAVEVAGLTTALISMGISEEETGTALRNMSLYLVKNADAVAQAMKNYEKYNETAKVTKAINEDALQVYLDIAEAASKGEDAAATFLTLMDIGNLRGGRALQAMANNLDLVNRALGVAREEYRNGTSLAQEYADAMGSTKNQLGLLKNNVLDVAITLGDTFLPVINQLVMVLVPAFRELNKWFKSLSERQKLLIVGVALLAVVIGPLLMIFGQLLHAVALIGGAFGQLTKFVPWILRAFGDLGGGILGFISMFLRIPFFMWPVIGAVILMLNRMGISITGIFTGLTKNADAWGEGLMSTLAKGIETGAQYVIRIITAVAEFIASFFESHSPPKAGPLKSIDRWGSALLRTFLGGFMNGDFDILSKVGKIIEKELTRGIDTSDAAGKNAMINALQATAKARVILANLIEKFNATGIIDMGMVREATAGIGGMRKDVQELLVVWLKYNNIQERIARLEERRKKANKDYTNSLLAIAGSSMNAVQKVEAIRSTQRYRDDNLRGLDKEQESLEEQKDILKEQLDFQTNLLDALGEQEDIFTRIAELMKEIAESLKDAAGAGGGGGGFALGDGLDDLKEKMEESAGSIGKWFDGLQERIDEGTIKWKMFVNGLLGRPMYYGLEDENASERDKMLPPEDRFSDGDPFYEFGAKIGGVKKDIEELAATIGLKIQEIGTAFDELKESFGKVTSDNRTVAIMDTLKGVASALGDIVTGAPKAGEALYTWGPPESYLESLDRQAEAYDKTYSTLTLLMGLAKTEGKIWSDFLDTVSKPVSESWAELGEAVGKLAEQLGILFGKKEGGGEGFAKFLDGFRQSIGAFVGQGIATAIDGITSLVESITTLFEMMNDAKDGAGSPDFLDNIAKLAWDITSGLTGGLLGTIAKAAPEILEWAQGIIAEAKKGFGVESPSTIFAEIGAFLSDGLMQGLEEKLSDAETRMATWLQALTDAADTFADTVMLPTMKEWFEGPDGLLTYWASDAFRSQWDTVGKQLINGLWAGMKTVMDQLKIWLKTEAENLGKIVEDATQTDSPSKMFREIGRNQTMGLLLGMQDPMREIDGYLGGTMVSQLSSSLVGGLSGDTYAPVQVNISLAGAVIRDEQDIYKLAEAVKKVLGEKQASQMKFGGAPTF